MEKKEGRIGFSMAFLMRKQRKKSSGAVIVKALMPGAYFLVRTAADGEGPHISFVDYAMRLV